MSKNFRIAVLIDGDNAQPKLIKEILTEVLKYGKATIRRIYGDWTSSQMNGWKEVINENSFSPIQKFAYTSGKNSTDSALIIDAMDILHEKNVEGFCIVSSDSDYTGLAKRIREDGIFVMGIGRKTTPVAFVQSCEIFTHTENIAPKEEEEKPDHKAPHTAAAGAKKRNPPSKSKVLPAGSKIDIGIIDKAFEISAGEDQEVFISKIGHALRKINPSFDTREFGFKTLTEMFENLPNYEVVKKDVNGSVHPFARKK